MNNQDALGDEQNWVKCPDCRTTWDTKRQPHNECPVCGKPTSSPLGRQARKHEFLSDDFLEAMNDIRTLRV